MKLKIWQRNIFAAIIIVVGGFALFNLAFLLAALVINGFIAIMGLEKNVAPPILGRAVYVVIVALISWLVLKSKANNLAKATFLTMPLMVLIVMLGISFYQQPMWLMALIGAAVFGAVLFYIIKKKLPWYYYFSVLYVAVIALCIMIFRIEI